MKKAFPVICLLALLFFSCATDDAAEKDEEIIPVLEEEDVIEVPSSDDKADIGIQLFVDEEPDIVSVVEEPSPSDYFEDPVVFEEYLRSVGYLSDDDGIVIPPQVFEEDKDQIFIIINDLARIMKSKDAEAWIAYLCPESYEYWSNRHNLLELSRHLFASDTSRINNIKEYFEQFFIPARRGRIVDEIRYITPDYVKVVQYKNNTDIIYYFFVKIDGEWKIRLDTL